MQTDNFWRTPLILLAACLAVSCSRELQKKENQNLIDGRYDYTLPESTASDRLEQISKSVFMVNCIGSYRTLFFEEKEKILLSGLRSELVDDSTRREQFSDNTVRGTATVILNDGRKVAFLTCAHVVSMPDTIVSYFRDADRHRTPYVRSIAIKVKQFTFVSPAPDEGSVDVVLCDTAADVAVVGRPVSGLYDLGIPAFRYGLGRSGKVRWGTFAYVVSCPAGIKMVTKALISPSAKDGGEAFFIDAAVGGGSSGGLVLAVREGNPDLELVGMIRLVHAKFSFFLAPKDEGQDILENSVYEGQIVVSRKAELEYGVTKCIAAGVIRRSLESNKESLVRQGYNLSEFTK